MASNAHRALSERLEDINQLMEAHEAVGGTERGRRFGVVALNRASVLLLSAHLEGYLEDLMDEAIAAINKDLAPANLTGRFANPTIGNINNLFGFLGMEKPCDSVSWRNAGNAAVKRNINQLVETRNRIAHGGFGEAIYKTEVTRDRNYVVGFARAFDGLVRNRVQAITGVAPWSAS